MTEKDENEEEIWERSEKWKSNRIWDWAMRSEIRKESGTEIWEVRQKEGAQVRNRKEIDWPTTPKKGERLTYRERKGTRIWDDSQREYRGTEIQDDPREHWWRSRGEIKRKTTTTPLRREESTRVRRERLWKTAIVVWYICTTRYYYNNPISIILQYIAITNMKQLSIIMNKLLQ